MIDENGGFGGEFWNSFTKSVFWESMYKGVPVKIKKKIEKKYRFYKDVIFALGGLKSVN
jgi:hypothetical protein